MKSHAGERPPFAAAGPPFGAARPLSRASRILALLLAAAAVLPLSCSRRETGPVNVLLVVVDTFRADRVGCYGAGRATTPSLDSLAGGAVRFARAYATAPWTIPSVGSILTGWYPMSHGAIHLESRLPQKAVTLAEILGARGYATGAVVSHALLSADRQFDKGFERFKVVVRPDHHNAVTTARVTRNAVAALDTLAAGDRPFFLLVHYFDPHYNYLRHREVAFAPPSAGRLHGDEDLEGLRDLGPLTGTEYRFLRDLYDEEIRHTDAGIGRLLRRLRDFGIEDRTLVLVTGDHGEEFGEHGGLGHARTLYEEVMRVPLLIRPPAADPAPGTVATPVSLASLVPTILDLAGIDPDTLVFQGESVAPLLSGEESGPGAGVVYFAVDYDGFDAHKKAILTGNLKVILDETTGAVELFDAAASPGDEIEISERDPEAVRGLLPVLAQYIRASREGALPSEVEPLSPADVERLRSLGYIH